MSLSITSVIKSLAAFNDRGNTTVGRIIRIVEKNLVLVNIIENGNGFQKGDSLAIKYDISEEGQFGLDNLEGVEAKTMESQVGDIVLISYDKNAREKRDVGGIKDCNYIRTFYLYIIPEERYESMYSDDADES